MADNESFPKYLDVDVESAKAFYNSSTNLMLTLQLCDASVGEYIDEFIAFNNAKSSPQPIPNKINTLVDAFNKFDTLPVNIAYFWYKKINNQIDSVKSTAIKLCGKDFKQISDSIGSLGVGYLAYNSNTTPYHTYLLDDIRPTFYIPNNTFNKIHPKSYANLITTSKYIDALFKHNLAPSSEYDNANLIQSNKVSKQEGGAQMYAGEARSLTSHGDNLVTDVNTITKLEQFKAEIRKQITLTYSKLYKLINAIKGRVLINSTTNRESENIIFNSVVNVDIDTGVSLFDMFDILQNRIKDFDKHATIDTILK